jgi:hypothetical protein
MPATVLADRSNVTLRSYTVVGVAILHRAGFDDAFAFAIAKVDSFRADEGDVFTPRYVKTPLG